MRQRLNDALTIGNGQRILNHKSFITILHLVYLMVFRAITLEII